MTALRRLAASSAGLAVGVLGGSFNPAHEGHLHVSRVALAGLGLDRVWWLVSPQNPLKPAAGMGSIGARAAGAKKLARADRRIVVSTAERDLGTRYTADTLERLCARLPRTRFVWLMGADNLCQLPQWERWTDIMATVPVAVFGRRPYSLRALAGKAAVRYREVRLDSGDVRSLVGRTPPVWAFIGGPTHPASATAIRASGRGQPVVNNGRRRS